MTRITVGRRVNSRSDEERIHVALSESCLNAGEARDLIERVEEQLALLDGGGVRSIDAVDVPEVNGDERAAVEQHPSEEMGAPEYQIGEEVPDEASESSEAATSEREQSDVLGLDELTAMQGVGERRVQKLIDGGFRDLADVDDASVGSIAVDGISEDYATKISRFAAEALAEQNGADDESDGDQEAIEGEEPDPTTDGSEEPADPDHPFGCPVLDCSKRFDDRDDRRTHRDNDHDEAAVMVGYRERARDDLLDGVSVLDVEQAAVGHTLVSGVAQQLDVANSDARKWLNMLQLNDVLNTGGEGQAVQAVEDLHEKLGIDEPLPNRPGQGGLA